MNDAAPPAKGVPNYTFRVVLVQSTIGIRDPLVLNILLYRILNYLES
jgi:hypothetical protein